MIMVVDYKYAENFSVYLYFALIFLLIITLLFGKRVNGARSWLGIMDIGIQPSEFAKLTTIIMLSSFYAKRTREMKKIRTLLEGFMIVLLPMLLIVVQPDMGTALVYIPVFIVISFVAGASFRHILYIILTGAALIGLTVIPVWMQYIYSGNNTSADFIVNQKLYVLLFISFSAIVIISVFGYVYTKKPFYYWSIYSSSIAAIGMAGSIAARNILKSYQIMRLVVFLDPYIDPKGAGWHIIQSITAVGSGGIFGKGFLNGTQSHLRYLPQQSTDFIFSIISEETGFAGCMVIFILFFTIIIRGLVISASSRDYFGANLAAGIVAMILFHFIVNIGMTMGIMPITGIPLLFLSYGGSSLWTAMSGAALLINIFFRRYRF
ncbi:MAG: rod shape-determining protein RodA, partial [Spirochaetia bacterium]|jgi:rod shape determining protein RodA|nr:rod shape-determining protein RodA [Spirochaetia bacterium]